MYALLSIIFFVAAMFSAGDKYSLIGFAIVSALFAIAAGISSIYTSLIDKIKFITDQQETQK